MRRVTDAVAGAGLRLVRAWPRDAGHLLLDLVRTAVATGWRDSGSRTTTVRATSRSAPRVPGSQGGAWSPSRTGPTVASPACAGSSGHRAPSSSRTVPSGVRSCGAPGRTAPSSSPRSSGPTGCRRWWPPTAAPHGPHAELAVARTWACRAREHAALDECSLADMERRLAMVGDRLPAEPAGAVRLHRDLHDKQVLVDLCEQLPEAGVIGPARARTPSSTRTDLPAPSATTCPSTRSSPDCGSLPCTRSDRRTGTSCQRCCAPPEPTPRRAATPMTQGHTDDSGPAWESALSTPTHGPT